MDNLAGKKVKAFIVIRDVITVVTVLAYVLFSLIKRGLETEKLYWIPMILVCANLAIIGEQAYVLYNNKELQVKSNILWIVNQSIINIGLGVLIYTYL